MAGKIIKKTTKNFIESVVLSKRFEGSLSKTLEDARLRKTSEGPEHRTTL